MSVYVCPKCDGTVTEVEVLRCMRCGKEYRVKYVLEEVDEKDE